jgi:hypothetical protein
MVGLRFVLNDLFQLLRGMLGRWAHTAALLEFVARLGISQTSIWTQYYILNSIHSISTYIITINLDPTRLLIHHSFIFIGSL